MKPFHKKLLLVFIPLFLILFFEDKAPAITYFLGWEENMIDKKRQIYKILVILFLTYILLIIPASLAFQRSDQNYSLAWQKTGALRLSEYKWSKLLSGKKLNEKYCQNLELI